MSSLIGSVIDIMFGANLIILIIKITNINSSLFLLINKTKQNKINEKEKYKNQNIRHSNKNILIPKPLEFLEFLELSECLLLVLVKPDTL